LFLTADGELELLEATAAQGVSGFSTGGTTGPVVFGTTDGFIDLDVSADGQYLYQLEGLNGAVSVYEIEDGSLTLIQELTGYLPEIDTQGLVAVSGPPLEGAVYTMTNGLLANEVVAFGINEGGQLALVIEDDFSLTLVSTINSGGVGPNSLAYSNGRLFVSNIDRDGFALGNPAVPRGEPNDEGNITGFSINANGILTPLANSTANLDNRPADLGFSADGTRLIVTSITAGSAALPGPDAANSVAVYGVDSDGVITGPLDAATGTQVGNAAGRKSTLTQRSSADANSSSLPKPVSSIRWVLLLHFRRFRPVRYRFMNCCPMALWNPLKSTLLSAIR